MKRIVFVLGLVFGTSLFAQQGTVHIKAKMAWTADIVTHVHPCNSDQPMKDRRIAIMETETGHPVSIRVPGLGGEKKKKVTTDLLYLVFTPNAGFEYLSYITDPKHSITNEWEFERVEYACIGSENQEHLFAYGFRGVK